MYFMGMPPSVVKWLLTLYSRLVESKIDNGIVASKIVDDLKGQTVGSGSWQLRYDNSSSLR
jgi:hypothetical protein